MQKRTLVKDTIQEVGKSIRICGWISTLRDHGNLVFIDLRDWTGIIQVVIDNSSEAYKTAKQTGLEYAVEIEGDVVERAANMQNDKLETGKIEVKAKKITILNKCKALPFPVDTDGREIDETLRLKYRFIDLRRKRVADLVKKRHEYLRFITDWYSDHDFVQVQTPVLTVSSPEGARDFLVPSRLFPGKFYALPQAPQQYKQLLMIGGLHRYFQIAPCMRDEDPRADRHYGTFYQIDVEFSFPTQQEIFESAEPFFKELVEKFSDKTIKYYPFKQIPYNEALDLYGSDKPDIRFEMRLTDLTEEFHNSGMDIFKTVENAKAILVDKEFSRKEIDEWTEKIKQLGAKGLVSINVVDGKLEGNMAKYFNEKILEKFEKNEYKVGGKQTIFAVAGSRKEVNKYLGWLRSEMGDLCGLKNPKEIAFAWIVDFDMFEWKEEEEKWDFMHNPFSWPLGGIEALHTQKPNEIKAQQYDLAGNGYELLSGSIRNHHPETFIEAFKICGYTEEETRKKFGHMIGAFEYGAPPHGGYAIGMDRLSMILFDEENIREIYAFPMSSTGQEYMMNSPREVDKKDLDILGIQLKDRGGEIVNAVKSNLESLEMDYKFIEHEEVRTSEEAAKVRGTKLSDGAKALVLHSLDYPSKYLQAVIPADKQLSIEKLSKAIDEKIEVASAEKVEEFTGLKVGAIPPFGRLLGMEVYFDSRMWEKETSAFNVGKKTRSIIMKTKDLIKAAEPNKISNKLDIVM